MPEFSPQRTKKSIIILLIVLISPFIINCFFAYPQTDDFCYSHISRSMGFLKTQYHVYITWSGRFTSTALLSINPLVYQSLTGYKLVFASLIIAQLASIYLLVGAVTKNILTKQDKLIFALLVLFAFLDQMDDLRSGLYWMAGVVTYQVAESLLFLFTALMLLQNENRKFGSFFLKGVVLLVALLLGGTNEIVLVLTLLITMLFILNSYVATKNINSFQITTLISVVTGCCVCLYAPGNLNRLSEYHDRKNILITAWNSLSGACNAMERWGTSPLTLMLLFIVLYAVIGNPQLKSLFCGYRIVSSACLLLFLMFTCFFIPYWSTGIYPQNRVINMIYLLFLIGLIMNGAIMFAHYGDTISCFINKVPTKTGGGAVILFFIILFYLGTSNFIQVSKDLLSGDSIRYNAEMLQREHQILNSKNVDFSLEDITASPPSLFFSFISQNKDYWVNGCYAAYFGKKSVTLIPNNNCKALN